VTGHNHTDDGLTVGCPKCIGEARPGIVEHHACRDVEPDDDGWFWASCTCGWTRGPLPDRETQIDSLMDHAREVMPGDWISV
jgi:hypothetical protein